MTDSPGTRALAHGQAQFEGRWDLPREEREGSFRGHGPNRCPTGQSRPPDQTAAPTAVPPPSTPRPGWDGRATGQRTAWGPPHAGLAGGPRESRPSRAPRPPGLPRPAAAGGARPAPADDCTPRSPRSHRRSGRSGRRRGGGPGPGASPRCFPDTGARPAAGEDTTTRSPGHPATAAWPQGPGHRPPAAGHTPRAPLPPSPAAAQAHRAAASPASRGPAPTAWPSAAHAH